MNERTVNGPVSVPAISQRRSSMSEQIKTYNVLAVVPCEKCAGEGCPECDGKGEVLGAVELFEFMQVSGLWEKMVRDAAFRSKFVAPVSVG